MLKQIRLQKDITKTMTFEEVYRHYEPVLRLKGYRWARQYEYDEMFQTAAIGLWKAYESYNLAEYQVLFKTFAEKVINNELIKYHQKHKEKFGNKKSQVKSIVSLDKPIQDKNGESIYFQDFVGEDERFSQEIADRLVLEDGIRKLTKKQQQLISNSYFKGYQFTEIAKANNISPQSVSGTVQRGLEKLRAFHEWQAQDYHTYTAGRTSVP